VGIVGDSTCWATDFAQMAQLHAKAQFSKTQSDVWKPHVQLALSEYLTSTAQRII
jgi:hypothetical protein